MYLIKVSLIGLIPNRGSILVFLGGNVKSMPFFSVSQTVTPVTADSTYKVTVDTLAEEDEPLDKKVIYNARDSIRYEAKDNKVYLFGDAYVEYGDMNLRSEFIEMITARI